MVDGKRDRKSRQFNNYDDAEMALQEHTRDMRDKKAISKKFTVEEMISEWKKNGENKKHWAITTVYGYDKILNNHIRPYFFQAKKYFTPNR